MSPQPLTLSASILSADLTRLGEEVRAVLAAGVDRIHIDVMDQHYVSNLSFGPIVCEALHRMDSQVFLDVHLMVQPVDTMIRAFAKAGAKAISFHPEASLHVNHSLALIREQGCLAGLALNPGTALDCLPYLWEMLDFILIMSVNPGFAAQRFISSALLKLRQVRNLIQQRRGQCSLAVDGGVHAGNILEIALAGADTFVVGSALFSQPDYATAVARLRLALDGCQ